MKSNYKKLGELITECDTRNRNNLDVELWGVSIDKKFIKSVANTIGTDLTKYKVVEKNDFVCSLMQVSRDEKIPIDMWADYNTIIVSPAYKVFRVKDTSIILPEFMNLWFKRTEFDREASFYGVGGVRGSLEWEDFCEMKLPVPEIEEQQKIVDSYRAIENRISILRQINDNLESQIQSIYEEYFADCSISESTKLGDYVECVLGGTPSRDNPAYWNGDTAWINSGKVNDFRITSASEFITKLGLAKSATKLMPKHTVVLAITGATLGQESILLIDSCANQSVVGILENAIIPYEFLYPFIKLSMKELLRNQTGGAQQHINKDDVKNIPFSLPSSQNLEKYVKIVQPFYNIIENNMFEIDKLSELLVNLLATLSH